MFYGGTLFTVTMLHTHFIQITKCSMPIPLLYVYEWIFRLYFAPFCYHSLIFCFRIHEPFLSTVGHSSNTYTKSTAKQNMMNKAQNNYVRIIIILMHAPIHIHSHTHTYLYIYISIVYTYLSCVKTEEAEAKHTHISVCNTYCVCMSLCMCIQYICTLKKDTKIGKQQRIMFDELSRNEK